jgi:para-aminobenzoate synthetase component I
MTPALPLVRPLALGTPLEALRALADRPAPFLLHSARPDARARWSYFGADPFALVRGGDFAAAARLWRELALAAPEADPEGPPFAGGAVGTWSYDFGRRLERLPAIARDDLRLPDFVLGFYDVVGAFDHATGRAWLIASGLPLAGVDAARRAARRLDDVTRRIEAGAVARAVASRLDPAAAASTFTRTAYVDAVERVRDHIRRGDIFQANLSQRWTVPAVAPGAGPAAPGPLALALYEALAALSPAPHAAFLDWGDHAVASASPERFLSLRAGRVEARPIKGTRPRGATPEADAALARALETSAKDRAENVMIVDVLRNDLGRACEIGSVEVPALCEREDFPQVFHLTSTVTGILRADLDALDLLAACFPGGSITGAPKIRAMEIIEALEPVRRHLYTGAIGWLGWSGDADWSIAIRTALVTPVAVHHAAGGGITADSEPEAEYEETLDKAAGMRAALAAPATGAEAAAAPTFEASPR